MKKNNKGFTLVELLAVIVVLSIIMAVAGTAALKIKKKADIETAKKLEQTLTDLGPNIYSYEMMKESKIKEDNPTDGNFRYNYERIESADANLSTIMDVDTRKTYQGYSLLITTENLKDAGYLNTDSLKIGNETCNGFIRIYKTTYGPYFEGNICCATIYSTNKGEGAIGDNCGYYTKTNPVGLSIQEYWNPEIKSRQGWVTTLTK